MVRWGKAQAKEGEAVELTAQVKDIDDGNMVTFQVWREGQDPASHASYQRVPANIEGGTAKGTWLYRPVDVGEEVPPEADPKFYFTAHSAWCPYKESGLLTVELKRPELSGGPEWQDREGASADKGLVGEALKLSVSCNEDMDEGAGVTFRVYAEGADPKRDRAVAELASRNSGGVAEAEWTYHYRHDPENPLAEKPKYFFTANGNRCKEAKSGNVEIVKNYRIIVQDGEAVIADTDCTVALSDGKSRNTRTNGDGLIELNEEVPGVSLWIEYIDTDGETHRLAAEPNEEGAVT
jgi:hypothetical protein